MGFLLQSSTILFFGTLTTWTNGFPLPVAQRSTFNHVFTYPFATPSSVLLQRTNVTASNSTGSEAYPGSHFVETMNNGINYGRQDLGAYSPFPIQIMSAHLNDPVLCQRELSKPSLATVHFRVYTFDLLTAFTQILGNPLQWTRPRLDASTLGRSISDYHEFPWPPSLDIIEAWHKLMDHGWSSTYGTYKYSKDKVRPDTEEQGCWTFSWYERTGELAAWFKVGLDGTTAASHNDEIGGPLSQSLSSTTSASNQTLLLNDTEIPESGGIYPSTVTNLTYKPASHFYDGGNPS